MTTNAPARRGQNRWLALLNSSGGHPAIVAHRRRYRYNVRGFRGVRYDVQMDRYFVLTYTGPGWRRGFEWARGDEMPGLTASQAGNIRFSDRTSALKARASQRWHKSVQYLPDVEQEYEPGLYKGTFE